MCCKAGKVGLQSVPEPPTHIKHLFHITKSGHHFLNHTKAYNNALALASLGCDEIVAPGYSPIFKIQGKLYHRIALLLPSNSEESSKFAWLYFHDSSNELQNRLHHALLQSETLQILKKELHSCNSHIRSFKAAIELDARENFFKNLACKQSIKTSEGILQDLQPTISI